MKYVIFLLCLAGLPLLGQPSGSAEQRRAKAEARWAENKQRMDEIVFENRVEQEVQRRVNEKQQTAQTAAVQAQQAQAMASSFYGGGYYNRWAPQVFTASQEGSVAIANKISMDPTPLTSFSDCVADLVATNLKPKEAVSACKDAAKIAADLEKRKANEAADATKSSRPFILIPRYEW